MYQARQEYRRQWVPPQVEEVSSKVRAAFARPVMQVVVRRSLRSRHPGERGCPGRFRCSHRTSHAEIVSGPLLRPRRADVLGTDLSQTRKRYWAIDS